MCSFSKEQSKDHLAWMHRKIKPEMRDDMEEDHKLPSPSAWAEITQP